MLPQNYIVSLADQIAPRVAAPRRRRRAHAAAAVPLQRDLGLRRRHVAHRRHAPRSSAGSRSATSGPRSSAPAPRWCRCSARSRSSSPTPTTIPTRRATSCGCARRRRCRPTPTGCGSERFGCKTFSGGYGLTEASLISMLDAGEPNKPGAAGKPNRHEFDVRLVDDDDVEVAPGEVGEIVCRPTGPNLMFAGYWNRPDSTVEATPQPLVPHRRPRSHRRRRLPLLRRPQEGRAAPAGREHLELRDGEDAVRPRGRQGRRGARGAERDRRGRREGHGRAARRRAGSARRSCAAGWRSGCRTSRSRATSSSATTCPATRSAGCSSTSSATKASPSHLGPRGGRGDVRAPLNLSNRGTGPKVTGPKRDSAPSQEPPISGDAQMPFLWLPAARRVRCVRSLRHPVAGRDRPARRRPPQWPPRAPRRPRRRRPPRRLAVPRRWPPPSVACRSRLPAVPPLRSAPRRPHRRPRWSSSGSR